MRDLVQAQFPDTLFVFEGEKKESPADVVRRFAQLEDTIAQVQAAQVVFNNKVQVEVMGAKTTLGYAIKRLGGAGRVERLWKSVLKKDDTPRWARHSPDGEKKREKDSDYARPTITPSQVVSQVRVASQFVAALREAIAKGNATEFEHEELGLPASALE